MLFTLLIGLIVFGIAYWVLTLIPLPSTINQIALVVLGLIALIWALGLLGVGPGVNL